MRVSNLQIIHSLLIDTDSWVGSWPREVLNVGLPPLLLLRLVLHTAAVGCVTLSSLSELTHTFTRLLSALLLCGYRMPPLQCRCRASAAATVCLLVSEAPAAVRHTQPASPGCPMDERILLGGEEGGTEQLMQLRSKTNNSYNEWRTVHECRLLLRRYRF